MRRLRADAILVLLAVAALGLIAPALSASPTETAPSGTSRGPGLGAEFVGDAPLNGVSTFWGHEDVPGGYGDPKTTALSQLEQLDLLRDMRRHATTAECSRQLDAVLDARKRMLLWALQMTHASARPPDAIMSGIMYHLGDYDLCVDVGSYCLVDVELQPAKHQDSAHAVDEESPFDPPGGLNATIWGLYRTSGNRRRYRRDVQQWGVCVPAACGRQEVGAMLAGAVAPIGDALQMHLRVAIPPGNCGTKKPEAMIRFWQQLDRPEFLAGTLFVFSFLVITLIATSVRAFQKYAVSSEDWTAEPKKQGLGARVLACFAIQGNWKHIKRKQKSQIHCIQGVRTLTMFCVILGHRCLTTFAGPLQNPQYVENAFTELFKMYIINGNMIVSTFFVISGFLEARLMLRELDTIKTFSFVILINHYVQRYFRLLPALAVALSVDALWVEHMGSGPIWNQLVGQTARDCESDWWPHLVFINNYWNPGSRCMYQTWFVAADMQMYLLMPVVMLVVWRFRVLGRVLLAVLSIAAVALLYGPTVYQGLHPFMHVLPQVLRRDAVFRDPTFLNQYVLAHTNAIGYVVGLLTGTLYYKLNKRDYQAPKWLRLTLWLGIPLMHGVQTVSMLSAVAFFSPTHREVLWLDALYGPARLVAYAVPTAWVIFTCSMGLGGVFDWILAYKPAVVLGRLTYCSYLVHISLINATSGSIRAPEYLSEYTIGARFLADIVITYVFALILHLCVEAPMWNVQKIVIESSYKKVIQKSRTEEGHKTDECEATTRHQSHQTQDTAALHRKNAADVRQEDACIDVPIQVQSSKL